MIFQERVLVAEPRADSSAQRCARRCAAGAPTPGTSAAGGGAARARRAARPTTPPRRPSRCSAASGSECGRARGLPGPRLLVCDEPVAALDVSVQAQVLNSRELREVGMGILFITHDLAVVRQMTERVYVMQDGRVVEAGPTADVLRDPSGSYTRHLLESVPRSDPGWLEPATTEKGD